MLVKALLSNPGRQVAEHDGRTALSRCSDLRSVFHGAASRPPLRRETSFTFQNSSYILYPRSGIEIVLKCQREPRWDEWMAREKLSCCEFPVDPVEEKDAIDVRPVPMEDNDL